MYIVAKWVKLNLILVTADTKWYLYQMYMC
jgi:hypothetical protein